MSRLHRAFISCLASLLFLSLLVSSAGAYSIKVHIHLANAIRDELVKNMKEKGKPLIRLKGPAGAEPKAVELLKEDAEAIRDFPEFFRAGAIGPDNTVFPGLTDPSHAWMFSPFSQCQTLLDASAKPEERAYALGCFLHGISDNTAHHVVNFFTGETFTLYPVDAAEGSTLKFSLLNVVRHITVEGKFEEAVGKAIPGDFSPDRLKHTLPHDLIRRVYFEDDGGKHGLWREFAGPMIQRKNDALRAAQLNGFDPNRQLDMTIEEIRKSGVTIDWNPAVFQAYIDFLSGSGSEAGSLTPADYVLFLPEIASDAKRLLAMIVVSGEKKLAATKKERSSMGNCTVTCPLIFSREKLWIHLFDKADNGGQVSRMQQAVDRKNAELDKIVDAYISTVEGLSNAIVVKGIGGLTSTDIAKVMQPLASAISQVADFPYDLLFPKSFVDIIEQFDSLQTMLKKSFILIVDTVKKQIMDRITAYLDQLSMQIKALRDRVLGEIAVRIKELKEALDKTLDAAKLAAIGLNLTEASDMFANFTQSVLYMNTFNSIAGALGNQMVVAPHEVAPGFFSGPVSFDASYQLTYNQLALCGDLTKVFYPCGHSATEMLQPNFAKCQKLGDMLPDANIECHRNDAASFATNPDPESCRRTELDRLIAPTEGHVGSYTLAYPASLASPPPKCINPPIVGINASGFGDKADCKGDGDCTGEYSTGCGCRSANAGSAALPLLGLALGLILMNRRRRRS